MRPRWQRVIGVLDDYARRLRSRWRRWRPVGEPFSCPRRGTEWGPWPRGPNLDRWEPGSWTRSRWRDWWRWRVTTWTGSICSLPWTLWPGPGPVPRVCSFDGGIHPEDAVLLVEAGWEVDPTDKAYKRYLEPPGSRAWLVDARRSLTLTQAPKAPFPCVKLYVQHFTSEQIRRFNAALARQAVA